MTVHLGENLNAQRSQASDADKQTLLEGHWGTEEQAGAF